jgi:hypothetical protein
LTNNSQLPFLATPSILPDTTPDLPEPSFSTPWREEKEKKKKSKARQSQPAKQVNK